MIKAAIFAVLLSSIAFQATAQDLRSRASAGRKLQQVNPRTPSPKPGAGAGRKLQQAATPDIRFGPECTNSYFKSAPDWYPSPNAAYSLCCDAQQGFICATYTGDNVGSMPYAACMTLDACKASNGGALQKPSGWNCVPENAAAPQCHNYYAK